MILLAALNDVARSLSQRTLSLQYLKYDLSQNVILRDHFCEVIVSIARSIGPMLLTDAGRFPFVNPHRLEVHPPIGCERLNQVL